MMEKDITKISALGKALQTIDKENTSKLIGDLTEVFRSAGGLSVIEFSVIISILCEIFAQETEVVTAEDVIEVALTLVQSGQVATKKSGSKTSLH